MRKIVSCLFLLLIFFCVKAQPPAPAGFPSPHSTAWYEVGFIMADSGTIQTVRDTTIRPRFPGFTVMWQHSGFDTSVWIYNGGRYIKQLNTQDTLPNRFLVTKSFLNSQGFIKNVTGFIQQGTNVTITGAGTFVNPYIINASGGSSGVTNVATGFGLTGGPITTTGTLLADTSAGGNGLSSYYLRRKDSSLYVTQNALTVGLSGKFNIPSGATSQYLRGDGSLANFPTNLSSFTNGPGYITGNQSISFTASGDINGTFTNPTVLTPTLTINANAVTYSKFQAAAGQGLLGATGAGNYQLITLGTGLSMAGNILNATGGGVGCDNCNADSIKKLPIDTTLRRNGYALTFDSVNHKWVLAPNGSGGGAISSVSNIDGTLTISPTTGAVIASLALGHANTWITNPQTFNGGVILGNNVTFSVNNTYQIGSGSAVASHVWSRVFNSDAAVVLSSTTGNPASLAIGASSGITLLSTGQAQFNNYTTSSSFTGTPLAFLQTDASGNIIQTPIGTVQGALSLTTTGSSGPATLIGNTLNIPNYAGGGGSGTVTSFSSGSLSPLFNVSVTNPTTTPAQSFILLNSAPNTVLGNNTGSSAAPAYFAPTATTLNTWFGGTIQPFLANTGSGYRIFSQPNGIKTIFCSGCIIDSTSNSNALTLTVTGAGTSYVPGNGLIAYPNSTTFSVDSIWKDRRTVAPSVFGHDVSEPSVRLDSNSQLLSLPSSTIVMKALFTTNAASPQTIYGESADSGKTWTFSATLVLPAGYCRNSFIRVGDSLIIFAVKVTNPTSTQSIDRFALFAKSAIVPATFTNVAIPVGGAGTYNSNGNTNSWIQFDADSNAYYLLHEGASGQGYSLGVYKSPDAINFTQFTSGAGGNYLPGAVSRIGGPWFTKINGVWWLWGHRSDIPNQQKNFYFLPSDLYRAYSPDLIHWYQSPGNPTLRRITIDEGVDSSQGQLADDCLVPSGNNVFMFFTASPNGSNIFTVKRVVATIPITSLVQTYENASTAGYWEAEWNRQNVVATGYGISFMAPDGPFTGGVGIGMKSDTSSLLAIGAGMATRAGILFDPRKTVPRANLIPGLLEADSGEITYVHNLNHSSILFYRDTLMTKYYLEFRLDSLTFERSISRNRAGVFMGFLSKNDSINASGNNLTVFGGSLQANTIQLSTHTFAGGFTSPLVKLDSGQMTAFDNTTQAAIHTADFYVDPYSNSQWWMGSTYNSSTVGGFVGNGTSGGMIGVASGTLYFNTWLTSSVGVAFTPNQSVFSPAGNLLLGATADPGTSKFISFSTTLPQIAFGRANNNLAFITVDGGRNVNWTGFTGVMAFPSTMLANQPSADSVVTTTTTTGTVTPGHLAMFLFARTDKSNTFSLQQNFAASTTTTASVNFAAGVIKTTPAQGDLMPVAGHLWYHDGSINYDLLNPTGGGSITLTTTGTTGAATLVGTTLNVPVYQGALTLTTTGTSGAATLVGNTLNIPQYTAGAGSPSAPDSAIQYDSAGVFSATAALQWQRTNKVLVVSGNASGATIKTGGLDLQGRSASDQIIGFNMAFNGAFTVDNTGFAGYLRSFNGGLSYVVATGSQTGGTAPATSTVFQTFNSTANFKIGISDPGSDYSTGQLQIVNGAGVQLALHRTSTNFITFSEDNVSFFTIKKTSPSAGGLLLSSNLFNAGNTTTDSVMMVRHGTGNLDTVTYVAASSFGGSSQTWQQTLTTGPTLNTTNTVTNTGQVFTWANGGTGTFKFTGLRTDTAGTLGVYVYRADSSIYRITLANLAAELPPFNLFVANGLTAAAGDSLYWNGPLNQPTTITLSGFPLKFVGLPPAVAGTATTALVRNATDSSLAQMSLSASAYVPSATGTANTSSVTSDSATWIRVGNTVTVTGRITVTATSATTTTTITLSIPINSNVINSHAVAGLAGTNDNVVAGTGINGVVKSTATANTVQIAFLSSTVGGSSVIYYHYNYLVQ